MVAIHRAAMALDAGAGRLYTFAMANTESTDIAPVKRPRLSARGKKIGRPIERTGKRASLPTRCPIEVIRYLKGFAGSQGMTLTRMYEDMLRRFVEDCPWEHGLMWRKPRVSTTKIGGNVVGTTGWVQVNIHIPTDLAESVQAVSETAQVSKAALGYTAMFWWCQYIYPPRPRA